MLALADPSVPCAMWIVNLESGISCVAAILEHANAAARLLAREIALELQESSLPLTIQIFSPPSASLKEELSNASQFFCIA